MLPQSSHSVRLSPQALHSIELIRGHAPNRQQGLSAMDAVAWMAGEPHTDQPVTACPTMTSIINELNDTLDDEPRQTLLKPLLPKLLDSRDHRLELPRRYIAHDWAIRTAVPAWLDLAGATRSAQAMRDLPTIQDQLPPDQLYDTFPILLRARDDVRTDSVDDDTAKSSHAAVETSGLYVMYLLPEQFVGLPIHIAHQAVCTALIQGTDTAPTTRTLRDSMFLAIDTMLALTPRD